MVSLKKVFKRYKYCFLLVSLFVMWGASQSFAARWICLIGQTKCCVNGSQSCCEDDGTVYDTTSCNGGSSGSGCGTAGTKEYKYTASGCSYSTSTRTCCSSGSWSGWDTACPTTKTCLQSSKPSTRTTCTGGYKTRSVTCNTSTGKWQTGAWSDCDCSDSAYESVIITGGGTCCQRKDGTGVRCRTDVTSGPSWHMFCKNCCNAPDTAVWSLSDCGTCTEAMAQAYPSYQCCVKSSNGLSGTLGSTTINGYVCGH